jgi:hypothetical protein
MKSNHWEYLLLLALCFSGCREPRNKYHQSQDMYYISTSRDGEEKCVRLDNFPFSGYNLENKTPITDNPNDYINR